MTEFTASTALNAARRQRELDELNADPSVDLLVIGAGVTGAGVALDAVTRGLSVVLVDKVDLAYGTSRWSSKLVHGGLRYLGTGHIGVAHESAVERGFLMQAIAPHLVHPLANVMPLGDGVPRKSAALVRAGHIAGDLLRRAARTSSEILPPPRKISAEQVLAVAPSVQPAHLRGGLLYWDGQLVDDARLVTALARSAAGFGAKVLTRCLATDVDGTGALLTDTLTGNEFRLMARAVVNATGVWAEDVEPNISLRPSRGTHLVFNADAFGGLTAALTVPVAGSISRFVFALPAPENRVYVGLTDLEEPKPFPDVPEASEDEIEFLLAAINPVLARPLTKTDVIGTFTGLRPLLDAGDEQTSDISRKHAVHRGPSGIFTIVGGKLTTYRRMAEDVLDAVTASTELALGPCRTRELALVGAGEVLPLLAGDLPPALVARLIEKYGTEASDVLALARGEAERLDPIVPGTDTSIAELEFAIEREGALDVADLLDRRSRIGLVPADRKKAEPLAAALFRASDGLV